MYDVLIIGAGVVGCAIAWRLGRYQLKVAVVEQGDDVAVGSSKANSGIIHAGFDPQPGTLMAGLNLRGSALYPGLCRLLGVPFRRTGSLVVARRGEEPLLEMLLRRGRNNGVADLAVIGRDKVKNIEPNLADDVTAALYAPGAGVVSPYQLTLALAENAAVNGVEFFFTRRVTGVMTEDGSVQGVVTNRGRMNASIVINAAGLYADVVAGLAGAERYDITPRKGEYLVLDRDLDGVVRQVVFPVPQRESKGVLVVPTVEGNVLAGPTARDVADRDDVATTASGLDQVLSDASRLVPGLDWQRVISSFAGLRAVADSGDFVIRASARIRGWIDAGGIQSPGLAAAPAIGEQVERFVAGMRELTPKASFEVRARTVPLAELPLGERQRRIATDHRLGRIVCRCEEVSEGEIIAALRSPLPVSSLDALKRRTRAGCGRCQGGFCLPRLVSIVARELGIPPTAVTKKGPGSWVVAARLAKGGAK